MRPTAHTRSIVFALMLGLGILPTVTRAQDITIPPGTDYLYTLPGSFFTFNGTVLPVTGNPVLPGGTDTAVQRLGDADATTGAPISTQITSLNLLAPGNLSITLDPGNLANDTGTMSFLTSGPTLPGTEIHGTIVDTLNVYFQVSVAGTVVATGHKFFTSSGTWEAFLPYGSNEVTDFNIILDVHTAPDAQHIVTSLPEPSTWVMLLTAGMIVPAYKKWGRRRA